MLENAFTSERHMWSAMDVSRIKMKGNEGNTWPDVALANPH